MPIEKVSRRNFLSTATLGSAALGLLPRRAQAEESEVFYSRADWDFAAFDKLLRAKRTVKQLFDVTEPDGEMLAIHVDNALTGLQHGFGVPKNRIMMVAALRAGANLLNFDDYAWKKYQIGATFKIDDPATKKPAERNIYYASTISPDGKYPSDDPNDQRSVGWDWSLQGIQRRGAQFLSCHAATEFQASVLAKRLKLKDGPDPVAHDLMAHLLPGVIAVPSMVSAIPMLETHGRFAYLRL
ncbi:MAG: twin-arginine translocation signal domain-containing protein [Acidobacteriaceae bacterium]